MYMYVKDNSIYKIMKGAIIEDTIKVKSEQKFLFSLKLLSNIKLKLIPNI